MKDEKYDLLKEFIKAMDGLKQTDIEAVISYALGVKAGKELLKKTTA